jgi:hypothetical protein
MADILQRADDPGVAPRGILLGHPHHQALDLQEHTRTTAAPFRVRPLAGDELPVPPKYRVGRDDRRDRGEATTAQPLSCLANRRRSSTVKRIRPRTCPTQDAVLFDQVGHGGLLPLIEPARERRQEHSEGPHVEHRGRVNITDQVSRPPSAEQ